MKSSGQKNRNILLIDDNEAIHEDFRAVLGGGTSRLNTDVSEDEAAIFGSAPESLYQEAFEIDSAFQGEEGLEKVRQGLSTGKPYAMAFVDIRMPPGWNGVETIRQIWREDPELQVCICTAYSDYSWRSLVEQLGQTDKLLILKKPFDCTEVRQVACSLIEKWNLSRQGQLKQQEVDEVVYELSEQLRMSGLLQRDFLPAKLPNTDKIRWAASYFPIAWASGDIYDAVWIDDHNIGFYVADVVGHGVPAALLTIFLKQALVMYEMIDGQKHILSPSDVMKNLNSTILAQELSDNQFVTCCYCLLNTETLELTYARSGHPYPVLIRCGEQPKLLKIQGSLLGIFDKAEYPQETIQLQSRDKLLLYSDGAVPAISESYEEDNFNFRKEFSAVKDLEINEMVGRLNTLAQNLTGKSSEADDITLFGLEIL